MGIKAFSVLGLSTYVGLSVLDYLFTFSLIQLSGGVAYESNPVAAACLERHGWQGLPMYKLGGVVVFVTAVGLLTSYRPRVAAGVASLGCVVLVLVLGYTHSMISDVRGRLAARDAAWGPKPEVKMSSLYRELVSSR